MLHNSGMHKYFSIDYYLTRILYFILERRRKRRAIKVRSVLKNKTYSTEYHFIRRKIRALVTEPGFHRIADDVTFVPEALFHIPTPWDEEPLSTDPKVAALVYEWKQIHNATYVADPMSNDTYEQMLEVKRELELHIDACLKCLKLSS